MRGSSAAPTWEPKRFASSWATGARYSLVGGAVVGALSTLALLPLRGFIADGDAGSGAMIGLVVGPFGAIVGLLVGALAAVTIAPFLAFYLAMPANRGRPSRSVRGWARALVVGMTVATWFILWASTETLVTNSVGIYPWTLMVTVGYAWWATGRVADYQVEPSEPRA